MLRARVKFRHFKTLHTLPAVHSVSPNVVTAVMKETARVIKTNHDRFHGTIKVYMCNEMQVFIPPERAVKG